MGTRQLRLSKSPSSYCTSHSHKQLQQQKRGTAYGIGLPYPSTPVHRRCLSGGLTASYFDTASLAVSPNRISRHAAMIPALPFPALQ